MATRKATKSSECPSCKTDAHVIMDYTQGDMICRGCGLVLEGRLIDDSAEWRSFADDEPGVNKDRAGTVLDPMFKDSGGTSMAGDSAVARTQRMIQNVDPRDKALRTSMSNLKTVCEAMMLPDRVYDACVETLKKIDDEEALKNKTSVKWMAAVAYLTCRTIPKVARTLREIAASVSAVHKGDLSHKDIGKCVFKLQKVVNFQSTAATSADSLLPRFCNLLQFQSKVEITAEKIVSAAQDIGFVQGKLPEVVAASAILVAATVLKIDIRDRFKETADVAKVAESTVKGLYQKLLQAKGQLLPELA